jgi:hypothetical protein
VLAGEVINVIESSSDGSRMNTKKRLNSKNLGLKLEINKDLRLINIYLIKKSGL